MSIKALFPLLFAMASFPASAGNWAVKNGWYQAVMEDDRALVMLRNSTTGITGLMQGYPSGVQTLLDSRISVSGNLIPTLQMCNQQTGFRAVEVGIGQASEAAKKAIHSIAERDVSVLRAFGVRMGFTRGDILRVCPKFITSFTGFSPEQTTTINRDSALQVARQTYVREYDGEVTKTVDFGSYRIRGNEVEFEVLNPEDRVYDKVTVTIGADDNAAGASAEFIGKQPVCQTATLFYCPKALSHMNKRLPSQQFTAIRLSRMIREHISGWLFAMPKGNYAGSAGILSLMPENS